MELTSLKESYSSNQYNLILEGFWDKVKNIAKSVGSAIGGGAGSTVTGIKKSVDFVHDLGTSVYDKGVELGKKAIEIGKDLYNKVANSIKSSIETIKKVPGLVWDNLVSLYTTISNEIGEIYEKAKEKGQEWVEQAKKTAIAIYNRMAQGLANVYNSVKAWGAANIEKFKAMIAKKQVELQEAANTAKQSSFDSMKQVGSWMSVNLEKLKNNSIDAAKSVGLFTLGLIALPFYASYWALVKTHQVGSELLAAMQSGIGTLKKNLGETWNILIEEMKASYAAKTATPAAAGAAPAIQMGKTYMYKGKEVETVSAGADGNTKVKPVGGNMTYAVKNADLTEKTNDSYSYVITSFSNFKY